MTKRCPKCGVTKRRSAFQSNIAQSDGLQVHCRRCRSTKAPLLDRLKAIEKRLPVELAGEIAAIRNMIGEVP